MVPPDVFKHDIAGTALNGFAEGDDDVAADGDAGGFVEWAEAGGGGGDSVSIVVKNIDLH